MRILIADDELMAREDLKDVILSVKPESTIEMFENYVDVLAAMENKSFDVAFLDIEMPEKNGLELSKELKDLNPRLNIIFVTGYSDYAVDAFYLNASGYILKPARRADVQNALDNLRIPIKYVKDKLNVQCFGSFEVFADGEIVKFRRNITKELFAYLVNLKGASANTNELCAVLFDEDNSSNKHYLRNIISDLKTTLKKYSAQDVFVSSRNSFAVDTSKIDCDYYRFLQYDITAINSYAGEYMNQYSWAEMTNGILLSRKWDSR